MKGSVATEQDSRLSYNELNRSWTASQADHTRTSAVKFAGDEEDEEGGMDKDLEDVSTNRNTQNSE